MIEVIDVGRDYSNAGVTLKAVDGINLKISEHEFVAITGHSGSGKSTLLGLLAGLDQPTRGKIYIQDENICSMNEEELSHLRGNKIGFVFQNFQLIPTMTALENVRLPAEIQGNRKFAKEALKFLEYVGLQKRAHHYPNQLSGGEMQRVAVARAAIHRPKIFLADEPTGNLDSKNGDLVIRVLQKIRKKSALVLVTHNASLAKMADREILLKDGKIVKIIRHKK